MAQPRGWRVVQSSRPAERYLLRYQAERDRIIVFLTNLEELWAEDLKIDDSAARARSLHCPIEIDVDDNRTFLVSKIRAALEEETGTSLTITRIPRDASITLSIVTNLPEPLPSLRWEFRLQLSPRDEFFGQILGPLISRVHQHNENIEHLQAIISEKDHVISKLLDRLESSGTDLSAIFPGTSNLRLSKTVSHRSQLSRYVKGIGVFSKEDGQAFDGQVGNLNGLADLLPIKNDKHPLELSQLMNCGAHDDSGHCAGSGHRAARGSPASRETGNLLIGGEQDDDENNFQVPQASMMLNACVPPQGSDSGSKPSPSNRERDHSGAEQSALSPASPVVPKAEDIKEPRKRKIGLIKRQVTPLPIAPEPVKTTEESLESAKTVKKAKIGIISSRRPQIELQNDPPSIDVAPESTQDAKTSDEDGRLSITSNHREALSNESAGHANSPRETSEQRANHRRDELKQKIDAQIVRPKVKRRRF